MLSRLADAFRWRWWRFRVPIARGVLARLVHYPKVFSAWSDGFRYMRAMVSVAGRDLEPIRLKSLKGEVVWCRSGTSDAWVLWDVFFNEFQRLPANAPQPKCIVDLGANVGYTVAWFAAMYPRARVVAVEMDEENWRLACQNVGA